MNIDSMIQGNPQALVTSYNGVLVADSLEVADRFGKRHTHVLRSIDDLINRSKIGLITLYRTITRTTRTEHSEDLNLPATALVFW